MDYDTVVSMVLWLVISWCEGNATSVNIFLRGCWDSRDGS